MKLQNNFTTQEQSRRLLELGLPADSADCYFMKDGRNLTPMIILYNSVHSVLGSGCFPCWSVGRLIEIYCILNGYTNRNTTYMLSYTINQEIDYIIDLLTILKKYNFINFTKLED